MNNIGGDGSSAVGRGGRVLLRRAAPAGRPAQPSEGALDGRPDSALRGGGARAGDAGAAARLQAAACSGSSTIVPDLTGLIVEMDEPSVGGAPAALPRRRTSSAAGAAPHAGREGVPVATTASARCRKYHARHPYVLHVNGKEYRVGYEPAESHIGLFGGNSNWRGPIWFPLNFLLIESLQRFHLLLRRRLSSRVSQPAPAR